MADLPTDLVVIPTSPWDERPTELPLDTEEVRTALWQCRGNITKAATLLKVTPSRLRRFVAASRYLTAEQNEAREQLKDLAEDVVFDALTDTEDKTRQDQMARYVLSGIGKDRGFANSSQNVNIKQEGGVLVVQWGDGEKLSGPDDDGKTIEGSANVVDK